LIGVAQNTKPMKLIKSPLSFICHAVFEFHQAVSLLVVVNEIT
jgi:hypothetical protein